MVVDRNGKDLLGPVLADHILIELVLDGSRRGDMREQRFGNAPPPLLLIDDRLAKIDALATDINISRSFDQRTNVAIALATKRAIGIAVPPGVPGGPSSSASRAGILGRHALSPRPFPVIW